MWQKVLVLVYSDRPLEERAEVLGISHGSVPTIVHDVLDISMLTDRSDPIAMHKCQQEHQSAAPCWSNLGERIIFFAPEDFDWNRFIISSVSRVWVPEANVEDATICWQGDSHTCSVLILWCKKCYIMLNLLPKKVHKMEWTMQTCQTRGAFKIKSAR